MQDILIIATAVVGTIVVVLTALWRVFMFFKRRNVILQDEESEHEWQGGKGEFLVRFSVENNQQREIPISGVHLFRNHVEMQSAPYTFELDSTIRSLGVLRRIPVKLIVEWTDPLLHSNSCFAPLSSLSIIANGFSLTALIFRLHCEPISRTPNY